MFLEENVNNVHFLSDKERKDELICYMQSKSGWPDQQYIKDEKGLYIKHTSYNLLENLNEVINTTPLHIKHEVLPKLTPEERWIAVRIAVAATCTFNKTLLCKYIHQMQLWHQMLVNVCRKLDDLSHINNSNLNDATKELVRKWTSTENATIPWFIKSDYTQPGLKNDWTVHGAMIPVHADLEALFGILLQNHTETVLSVLSGAIRRAEVPEPRLSEHQCSEVCRNDITLSRLTNSYTERKIPKIDAILRPPSEKVIMHPVVSDVQQENAQSKLQQMKYDDLILLCRRNRIRVVNKCQNSCTHDDCVTLHTARGKLLKALLRPCVLLWGKKNEQEANYLLCKVSLKVFQQHVDMGQSHDLLSKIHRTASKPEKETCIIKKQLRKLHQHKSHFLNQDEHKELRSAAAAAFGESVSDAERELEQMQVKVKKLKESEYHSVHLTMSKYHRTLTHALPHCFFVSFAILFDVQQTNAVLDHHAEESKYSSIMAGAFPNERNYCGHRYLFDVVYLPQNYKGHEFNKVDQWMVGMDLYSRMLFASKSQGKDASDLSAALARVLNQMQCTDFKIHAAQRSNPELEEQTKSNEPVFRDLNDTFLPLGEKVRNIECNAFGMIATKDTDYKNVCAENALFVVNGETKECQHIPPGYAMEESWCQSTLEPVAMDAQTYEYTMKARDTRDHEIRTSDFVDELHQAVLKFKSEDKYFVKQYSKSKAQFREVLGKLAFDLDALSDGEVLQKLKGIEEDAISSVHVDVQVLVMKMDDLDKEFKDHPMGSEKIHAALRQLQGVLYKDRTDQTSTWDEVFDHLSKIMKVDEVDVLNKMSWLVRAEVMQNAGLPKCSPANLKCACSVDPEEQAGLEKVCVQGKAQILDFDDWEDFVVTAEWPGMAHEALQKKRRRVGNILNESAEIHKFQAGIRRSIAYIADIVNVLKKHTFKNYGPFIGKLYVEKTADSSESDISLKVKKLTEILVQLKGVDPLFVDTVLQVDKREIKLRSSIDKRLAVSSKDIPNMCTYVFTDSSTTDFGWRSTKVITEAGFKHVIINKSSVGDETRKYNPLIMSPIESQFKQIRIMQLLKVMEETIFNRNGGKTVYPYDPGTFVDFGHSGWLPDSQMKVKSTFHMSSDDMKRLIRIRNMGLYKSTGHAPVDLWKKDVYHKALSSGGVGEKQISFGRDVKRFPVGSIVDIKLVGEQDQGSHPANRRVSRLAVVKHNQFSMELTCPSRQYEGLVFDMEGERMLFPGGELMRVPISNTSFTRNEIERVSIERVVNAGMIGSAVSLENNKLQVKKEDDWVDLNAEWNMMRKLPTIQKDDDGEIVEVHETHFKVKTNTGVHILELPTRANTQAVTAIPRKHWTNKSMI